MAEQPNGHIEVTSIFGQASRLGLVQMEKRSGEKDSGWSLQLRPDEATHLAHNLLSAAEAARGEQALWRVCERLELPDLMRALVIELRSVRAIEEEQGANQ